MKILKNELRDFLMLWSTQSISQLGSSITAFAQTLWLYENGIFQRASFMVYWSADWMDPCTGYECESGCDSQDKYSGRFAGACVCLPQYISIFYDSNRIVCRRLYGRQGMRTVYERVWSSVHVKRIVWRRQRFWRGTHDVSSWCGWESDLLTYWEEAKEVSL